MEWLLIVEESTQVFLPRSCEPLYGRYDLEVGFPRKIDRRLGSASPAVIAIYYSSEKITPYLCSTDDRGERKTSFVLGTMA